MQYEYGIGVVQDQHIVPLRDKLHSMIAKKRGNIEIFESRISLQPNC